jgi:L-idonate 5-dehydrogenase
MILGHEVAGYVENAGTGANGLKAGDLVAVSASRPCYSCQYCEQGHHNHCLDMRFYGSAMPFPHIQGAFSEYLAVDANQCVPAPGLTAAQAAMAEPLSVALHAASRAGDLMGKRVLVTGCGPIGLLAVLVARAAGAVQVVATDVADYTLDKAKAVGADATHNAAEAPDALNAYADNKGHFDVMFECSGVAAALAGAVPAMKPRGIVMQLGLGGDMTLPMQAITAKELEIRGCFRWHAEFVTAVQMMCSKRLVVDPLVTHSFSVDDAVSAFEMASDRNQTIKTQIAFC